MDAAKAAPAHDVEVSETAAVEAPVAILCDKCGQSLIVSDWPFCPHGPAKSGVIQDTIDFWATNAWREERHFTSQKAYEAALAADGMELRPRHVPGGRLANWATMDPQTLENGRILAERQAHTKASDDAVDTAVPMTWDITAGDGGSEITVGDL